MLLRRAALQDFTSFFVAGVLKAIKVRIFPLQRDFLQRTRDLNTAHEAINKALVLVALDTLFNERDYGGAEQYWSPGLISIVHILRPAVMGCLNS